MTARRTIGRARLSARLMYGRRRQGGPIIIRSKATTIDHYSHVNKTLRVRLLISQPAHIGRVVRLIVRTRFNQSRIITSILFTHFYPG